MKPPVELPDLPEQDICLVVWRDAMSTDPTDGYSELELAGLEPMVMFDVGFYNHGDGAVKLAGNVSEPGVLRRIVIIPDEMIIEIVKLPVRGYKQAKAKEGKPK